VKLTVYRKSEKKKFTVTVTRDVIPIKSVDVAIMVSKTAGYIKINRFAETTYDEFLNGLAQLKKQGANEIIIDLRDNGGGYLESAVAIADEFLKKDELIVKTKNKKGNEDFTRATEKGIFESGKVTLLINEETASASEILAGAIQDNDRGTIVGRRSFGKGLVQREMPLGDGSAVRLTVARYYTPSGRSIQKPYEDKGENYFNIRASTIAPEKFYKKSLMEWIFSQNGKSVNGFCNHFWNGLTSLEFAKVFEKIIDEDIKLPNTLHLTAADWVTKYQLLVYIKEIYSLDIQINGTNDKESVDRRLSTVHGDLSKSLTNKTIYKMLEEMRDFYNEN
jgi:hypothetical protein